MIAWVASSLRRLRGERVSAVGLAGLVFVTAFAAAATPRLLDRVANDTLLASVGGARPAARNIQFLTQDYLPPSDGDPFAAIVATSDEVHAELPDRIAALVSERAWTAESGRFRLPQVVGDPATMRLRIQPDAEPRFQLEAGRWPTGATTQTPDVTSKEVPQPMVTTFEVALPVASAVALGAAIGQTLILQPDGARLVIENGPTLNVAVTLVGTYSVIDAADPWWLGGTELAGPTIRSPGGDAKITDTVGVLAPDAYPALFTEPAQLVMPIRYTFREYIDIRRLSASGVDAALVDLRRLEAAHPSTNVTNSQLLAMRTSLRAILETFRDQWAAASAVLTVSVIGPAAVAAAALGLVAVLAAQRRRSALVLARGRGASLSQVIVAVVAEGLLLSVLPALIAVVLAVALIPADALLPSLVAGLLVAIGAVTLLVFATVPATGGPSFSAAREPAAARAPTPRRLILEGFAVVLAVGAAVLLRDRGLRGASSVGQLSSADPLVAAVPALIGIAAGLLAVRLYPIPISLLASLARRRRGLVPLLALRHAGQATSAAPVLIVLLATATVASFSSAILVHLDRAAEAVAWQQVGAAYRIDTSTGALRSGFDPANLPGVEVASVAYHAVLAVGPRSQRSDFLAISADAYERVTAGTPAAHDLPVDLFASSSAEIPLVVSSALAAGPDGLKLGTTFPIPIEGYTFPARVVAIEEALPAFLSSPNFVIASRDQMRARFPSAALLPSIAWLRAPDGEAAALRAALNVAMPVGATLTSRAEVTAQLRASPAGHAVVTGVTLAALITAIYAALAVAAAMALAGAARAVEIAHLRTVGLTGRQAAGLVVVEHGPTIAVAFAAGIALGVGLVAALRDSLGLDALVGAHVDVPITIDPGQFGAVLGGIVAVVVLGLVLGARLQRGAAPLAAVRRGFE